MSMSWQPLILRTLLVSLFSIAPLAFVLIQQRAIRRQKDVLQTLPAEVQATKLWHQAQNILGRRHFLGGHKTPPAGGRRAVWPMLAYWTSLGLVSLLMFNSWNFAIGAPIGSTWFVDDVNLFLSGPRDPMATGSIASFQTSTLAVTCLAFEVAYVVVLTRMLMRLNINEYSSLENLFDALHITGAVIVSAVGTLLLDKTGSRSTLTLFFAIGAGLRPDFYLASLGEAAYLALTNADGPFAGLRSPARPSLPPGDMVPSIPLEAVDGLDADVAGRLRRIDITTCHRLALSNPLVIWGRTPSTLPEVVDWVGQALLLNLCPGKIKSLRDAQIRTTMDLLARLGSDGKGPVDALGIKDGEGVGFRDQLSKNSQIVQLDELSAALLMVDPVKRDEGKGARAAPAPKVSDPTLADADGIEAGGPAGTSRVGPPETG